MSGLRGLVLGTMALALLEATVSSTTATANANTVTGFISHGIQRWISPYQALIPDLRPAVVAPGTVLSTQPDGTTTIKRAPTTGAGYSPPAAGAAVPRPV